MARRFRIVAVQTCLAALVLVLMVGVLRGAVGITPAFVEVKLDKGRPAGKFVISNPGDVAERYRVRAIHFVFSTGGAVTEIEPDENSLAKWIMFNPKEVSLPPKSKQTVRFVIIPRGKLRPGEYWAGMELESLKTSSATGKDPNGRVVKLQVIPSILVPIFGTAGKVEYAGTIKSTKVTTDADGTQVQCLLNNTGTGRLAVTGSYEVIGASGTVVAKGPSGSGYIFRGCDRRFRFRLKDTIPAGNYTLRLRYRSAQLKDDLTEQQQIVYKPPAPVRSQPETKVSSTAREESIARTPAAKSE
ncbi:MAG TPA: hypothetical protein VNA25_09960 [Phycisphaerae bacterium]|nr:hypothetical protein [Phycisphaerae bacterium]